MDDARTVTWYKKPCALGTPGIVFAISITHAAIAHAQERVTLADGTVMQGELVEKVPGDHITIKLATGEVRTIRWSALAPQMQAPPPQVTMQQPQAPQGPMAHVTVDGDQPGITLMRVMGFGFVQYGTQTASIASFQTVCVAPCQADVDTNAMYQVGGDGITPSSTFAVPAANSGPFHLHVHGGSLGARVGGLWLLVGGITLLVTGGIFAGTFAAISTPDNNTTGWIVGGLVTAGIGAIMTAFGIPLVMGSGTSVMTDQNVLIASHRAGAFLF